MHMWERVSPTEDGRAPDDVICRRRMYCGAVVIVIAIVVVAVSVAMMPSSTSNSGGGGGGGGGSSSAALPAVKPPVQRAAPGGMSLASFVDDAVLEFRYRFFGIEGPTNVFQLLNDVDGRTAGISLRIEQFPCLDDPSIDVTYNLTVWGGDPPVEMHAQCAEVVGEGFVLVWRSNTTVHLYDRGPETAVAAIVETNATTGNVTRVELWYSVGLSNLNGSHAVVHLVAEPATRAFEMTASGNGIGFCGAHLLSDGTAMRLTGSSDMGATCAPVATVCVSADSVTNLTACIDAPFMLSPLGRLAYTGPGGTPLGASQYPGGSDNSVLLRADGVDDTLFGPSEIPAGLS